jgi:hypothetical protein
MSFHPFFVCALRKKPRISCFTPVRTTAACAAGRRRRQALCAARRHAQHDQAHYPRTVPPAGLPAIDCIVRLARRSTAKDGPATTAALKRSLRVELARLFARRRQAAARPLPLLPILQHPHPCLRRFRHHIRRHHENIAPLPVALLPVGHQPADRAELPFHPSCSNYAIEALQVHGAAGAAGWPVAASAAAIRGTRAATIPCRRPAKRILQRPLAVATTPDKYPNGYQ